jgi:hypothetical protein
MSGRKPLFASRASTATGDTAHTGHRFPVQWSPISRLYRREALHERDGVSTDGVVHLRTARGEFLGVEVRRESSAGLRRRRSVYGHETGECTCE